MSPVFLLLPGCNGWELVDVRGELPPQPLISGHVRPAAALSGDTPSIPREKTQV